MITSEPTTEEEEYDICARCGKPILKGEEICDDCKDDLNLESMREAEELHQRYVEAERRGEL